MNTARIVLIQPPFTQLNAPYPSIYYLAPYLRSLGFEVETQDHSISLFLHIFSRQGLEKIFRDAAPIAAKRLAAPLPAGDEIEQTIRSNLLRFIGRREDWLASVDRVVAFLRGEDREYGHLLAAANGAIPDGPRMAAFLESVEGSPAPEDASHLASLYLADLADFITETLDSSFSLARYAESLSASVHSFALVQSGLNGYILREFYVNYLQECWQEISARLSTDELLIVGCTIPFPGCLAGALCASASAKAFFGQRVRTVAGGGYVNTELRSISSLAFFDYVDYLCFDRGYGAWQALLEQEQVLPRKTAAETASVPLYKCLYRHEGTLIGQPDSDTPNPLSQLDDANAAKIFPDYSSADFTRYLRICDSRNPMHRLWSDGKWLKAYLAHGCYWKACAFCDVQLDYIRCFLPVNTEDFYQHMKAQAEQSGVHGIHLVDEAAPAASLLDLAIRNRRDGLPLVFWGNIRWERDFTADRAEVLAAGGLLGVSAGIEVAGESGLKRLGKGIRLQDVVSACAAFKEAGILTHAYLIYGYWDESPQELIDSVEILRQLFTQGLIDSAFWHKFVLTRHSRIYAEFQKGKHPDLTPAERSTASDSGSRESTSDFADNDLAFQDEAKSERYTQTLDAILARWMNEEDLDIPVQEFFPFKMPPPAVSEHLITDLLQEYILQKGKNRSNLPAASDATHRIQNESSLTKQLAHPPANRVLFIGGEPQLVGTHLRWRYQYQEHELDVHHVNPKELQQLLAEIQKTPAEAEQWFVKLNELCGTETQAVWNQLRQSGLLYI
jgi:hypothetical protein